MKTNPADSLDEAYSRARQRWPQLEVSFDSFRTHIEQQHIDSERATTHAIDLLLVVAALQGSRQALKYLDELLVRASNSAAKLDRSAAFIDDVRQEMRLKLVAGPSPRLRSYA